MLLTAYLEIWVCAVCMPRSHKKDARLIVVNSLPCREIYMHFLSSADFNKIIFFFCYFMDTIRVLNSLKSDLGPKSFVNPYKPSILLVGHRQTMQNQIRCSLSDQVLHCLKTEGIIHLIVHKGLKFIICHNIMQYYQTFTVIECCIQKVPPPPPPPPLLSIALAYLKTDFNFYKFSLYLPNLSMLH